MSLGGLISGAECAVNTNPLSQVLKHTDGDRSLQQDRIGGPSSSRLQHLPPSSSAQLAQPDAALARQFFDGAAPPANFSLAHGPPPQLLAAEHAALQHMHAPPADLRGAWPAPAMQHQQQRAGPAQWAAEFEGVQAAAPLAAAAAAAAQGMSSAAQPSYMPPGVYSQMPLGLRTLGAPFGQLPGAGMVAQVDTGKGKGKAISAEDFEAAFAEAAGLVPAQSPASRFVELDDTADLAAAMAETKLDEPEGAQKTNPLEPDLDMAYWESEFQQLMEAERGEAEYEYGQDMRQAWENGVGNYGSSTLEEKPVEFDAEGVPIFGPYVFEKENKHLGPSTSARSLLDDAKALLDAAGSLSEVALLLEAAIQRGELGAGGYESWLLLGEVRSMDEREEQAIAALAEGVQRAEQGGAAGAGMLSLAISYTNESYERGSNTMLLRWLRARFPDAPVPEATLRSTTQAAWHANPLITDAFLALAREQHAAGVVDADVQIALGVLFYARGEYEHAADCFQSALAVRPDDFRLWNRYGSCLSNGNKPEESLGAYREALSLRPTYTRAVYNVAVACMNIGAHTEAVDHLLAALASQEGAGGAKSAQLWTTLQRAFSIMNRFDLAEMAKNKADLDAIRRALQAGPSVPPSSSAAGPRAEVDLDDWLRSKDVTA